MITPFDVGISINIYAKDVFNLRKPFTKALHFTNNITNIMKKSNNFHLCYSSIL
jgi:hypothetical protein